MNLPTAILIAAFAAVAIIVIVWSLRDGLAQRKCETDANRLYAHHHCYFVRAYPD